METLWYERGYFGLLGNDNILVNYLIISCQIIKVYRIETIDMGRFRCNNVASVKCNLSKYCGIYCAV